MLAGKSKRSWGDK